MVLDGRSIIEKRLVTFPNHNTYALDIDDQVQPNGIDLRIGNLYEVHGNVDFPTHGAARTEQLKVQEQVPKEGWFYLKPASLVYWVDFLEDINVPEEWCAILIGRSSLIRAGVDVMAGLWDTGFTGRLGCSLRVHQPVRFQWGAKLCQVMFHQSKFTGQYYSGRYQGTNSQTAIAQ